MSTPSTAVPAEIPRTPRDRARYMTPENGFAFSWPAVPARQFLAERDAAFSDATPTGAILLDCSAQLATPYPATTPTLLLRYLKLRAGERLRTAFQGSGEVYYVMTGSGESRHESGRIEWGTGDLFCFPGGADTTHIAATQDCLLFCGTNEPLLAYERLRPPALGQSTVETTHWPAAEIARHFETVWQRELTSRNTGHFVQFSSTSLAPSTNTLGTVNVAINTLPAGADQAPHRHNGVAVTLAIQGEGIHSLIDGERIDWATGAAQITPATAMHSHHNRGTQRMRSLVFQDEALHYYTRTPGFSFG